MRHGLVDGPHRFVCGKVFSSVATTGKPIPGRERCQDAQILSGRSTLIGVASGRAGRGRGASPDAVGIAWAQQLDGAADDSGGAEGAAEAAAAEDAAEDDVAQVPTAPVVTMADNYDAATNADDLITKALDHGTLLAAQAKASCTAKTGRPQLRQPAPRGGHGVRCNADGQHGQGSGG